MYRPRPGHVRNAVLTVRNKDTMERQNHCRKDCDVDTISIFAVTLRSIHLFQDPLCKILRVEYRISTMNTIKAAIATSGSVDCLVTS